ncbi:Hsp20 family protein [Pectobacterium brasiliense]|uniref:Hsp20 family protein n=1 Tax=Pectobacterium brasiliense TaxID=180957 RepID=UPI0004E78B32|nr:Hsp20 family protein [Pectobacterium brasiliense]KFF70280.1 hypothetical protein IW00_05835 [Pectobacterium brasiliense]
MSLRNFPVSSSLIDSVLSDRFNRIDRLFSQLTGDTPVSLTPPYDLKQVDDEHYALTISVPGWKESDLEIEVAGGRLTVTGRKESVMESETDSAESSNEDWLHRGISRSDFQLSYSVPEHMKVKDAKLEDGLLSIGLHLEIPESEKPQRIPIEHRAADTIEHQS